MKIRNMILIKYLVVLVFFLPPIFGAAYVSRAESSGEYPEQILNDGIVEQDEYTEQLLSDPIVEQDELADVADELDIYSPFHNIVEQRYALDETLMENDSSKNYVLPVSNLGVTYVTTNEIGVAWTNTMLDLNSVTHQIYVNDMLLTSINGTESSYIIRNLSPGNFYRIRIRTILKNNPGVYVDSNTLSVTTLGSLTPVSNLRYTGVTNNSVSIAWDNTVSNYNDVWHYVYVNGVSNQNVEGATTSLAIYNLNPNTTYQIYVITVPKSNPSSGGVQSPTITVTTSPGSIPGVVTPVSNLRASLYYSPGGFYVALDWENTMSNLENITHSVYVDGQYAGYTQAASDGPYLIVQKLPGTHSFYVISKNTVTGQYSAPSNTVIINVPYFKSADMNEGEIAYDSSLIEEEFIVEKGFDSERLIAGLVTGDTIVPNKAENVAKNADTAMPNFFCKGKFRKII